MTRNAQKCLDGSLLEAASLIRSGALSPEELTRAAIDRIASDADAGACFVRFRPEAALTSATRLSSERAEGASPLFGIPVANKDMFSVENDTATFCAHPQFHTPGKRTAPALDALSEAGAINLGGLHMAEFALGSAGWNETHGYLANPRDPERVTGGSSSGSAAAVARRLVFAALGTDTGGSIRIPASFCGVVGFKPTNGLVPAAGVFPASQTLDTVGPLARKVEDCACVMDALTGGRHGFLRKAKDGGGGKTWRVGLLHPDSMPTPPEPEAMEALEAARRLFDRQGHVLVDIRTDLPARANIPAGIVFLSEAGAVHRENLRGAMARIGEQVRNRLLLGLTYPAAVYLNALWMREAFRRRWHAEVTSRVDVLLCPSTPCRAIRTDVYAGMDANAAIAFNSRIGSYTPWANYLGLPALSFPVKTGDPLSVGVQIIGDADEDAAVLRLGCVMETAEDGIWD